MTRRQQVRTLGYGLLGALGGVSVGILVSIILNAS